MKKPKLVLVMQESGAREDLEVLAQADGPKAFFSAKDIDTFLDGLDETIALDGTPVGIAF